MKFKLVGKHELVAEGELSVFKIVKKDIWWFGFITDKITGKTKEICHASLKENIVRLCMDHPKWESRSENYSPTRKQGREKCFNCPIEDCKNRRGKCPLEEGKEE